MEYLTNYYRNLSEQLEEKLKHLQKLLTEVAQNVPPSEIPNPFAPNMYQPPKESEKNDSLSPKRGITIRGWPRPPGYPADKDWPTSEEVTWTYNGTTFRVGPPGFSIWVWQPDTNNPNGGQWFWRDWY